MEKSSTLLDVHMSSLMNLEISSEMLQRKWLSSLSLSFGTTISQATKSNNNNNNNDNKNNNSNNRIIALAAAEAQELFCEACSTLYNDILNAVDHHLEVSEKDILCRQMEIVKQGTELSNVIPELSNLIASKLSTVSRAVEHLKMTRQFSLGGAEIDAKVEGEPTALSELRKWIQATGEKLTIMESKFTRIPLARKELDRLAADQQVLQLQIESEGHTLVKNVERTVARYSVGNDNTTDCCIQRRERHLRTLTQRWYHLWIRSLSVQCRIELQLDQLFLSDEESESDPELREPQVKRGRFFNNGEIGLIELEDTNGLFKSEEEEEDVIPFAEEEYESIVDNSISRPEVIPQNFTFKEQNSWQSEEKMKVDDEFRSSTTTSDSLIGMHQQEADKLWSKESDHLHETVPHTTILHSPKNLEEPDEQRRKRIQCSPVKSFYKTVPLDETGATDTETPRVSMCGWPTGILNTTDVHVLTDSLIVNTEDEPEGDSNDDMKEILSMLDADDENGNPKWEELKQKGTRWREFKCGSTHYQLPFSQSWLFGSVDGNDKQSCDASSEESDDLPTDLNSTTIAKATTLPMESRQNSLKRRRKSRINSFDRYPLLCLTGKKTSNSILGNDMGTSICSQACSELTYLNSSASSMKSFCLPSRDGSGTGLRSKNCFRRKLRARRLPRSMSDGEHLGMWMNMSTHSAPGVSVYHWDNGCYHESDATGPEHSDVPPYEWDDYNPPAKAEDEWDIEGSQEDISVLTIEDDFHMHLGDSHLLPLHASTANQTPSIDTNETPINEKASRPVATVIGKCASKQLNDYNSAGWQQLELVKTTATTTFNAKSDSSGLCHHAESDLGRDLISGNATITSNVSNSSNTTSSTVCSQSLPSPSESSQQSHLSDILSKIEKFATSLKSIQYDNNACSSSLSTLSDVDVTLKFFNGIHERLLEEQEELKSLLSLDSFSGELSDLVPEFEPLCKGYEEAVGRMKQLMAQIEAIRDKWIDWAETQRIMQTMMRAIESNLSELRKGADNSQQICAELELCQERMNRLETVCNYLSCNLASLQHLSSSKPLVDFTSELALYSNALIQLKTRFEKEMGLTKCSDKSTLVRSGKRSHLRENMKKVLLEQGTCMDGTKSTSSSIINWSTKALFMVAVVVAFTAWFATSSQVNWRTTVGPHLDYIDGPPPL